MAGARRRIWLRRTLPRIRRPGRLTTAVSPYGPPPGYPYGYPPRGYPPPEAHREPRSAPPGGSYAEEKPAAYKAFKQQAVRMSSAGAEVGLSNGMCQDRHVNDFLLCFQCWLFRTFGDPRGAPWRLRRLDLSRNSLSDENLCAVLDGLKSQDVRVERILLSGNRMRAAGLSAVTEYIWNCRDPVIELDLSDNELHGEPGENDGVSALLRCLYNHPSYPMMQDLQLRCSCAWGATTFATPSVSWTTSWRRAAATARR
ncbi:unnamed protein product [Effrenium voratum]|nr:unnamed protein product [Effrenium voratum]